jgi:hypothetical protein
LHHLQSHGHSWREITIGKELHSGLFLACPKMYEFRLPTFLIRMATFQDGYRYVAGLWAAWSLRSRRYRSNRCPPRDEHGGTKLQRAHACRSAFVHPPEHFQTKSSSLGVHSSPLELITTRVRRLGMNLGTCFREQQRQTGQRTAPSWSMKPSSDSKNHSSDIWRILSRGWMHTTPGALAGGGLIIITFYGSANRWYQSSWTRLSVECRRQGACLRAPWEVSG